MPYRTPPAITSIDIGLPGEQELDDLDVAFASGDVKGSPPVQVNAVDIDPFVEQILHSLDVPSASHEQQLHRGVEILRHLELYGGVLPGAPAYRVQRGLPSEAEPLVVPPGVQRRLPRELPAQRPLQRPRRELPRYPLPQLRRYVRHFIHESMSEFFTLRKTTTKKKKKKTT